MGRGAGSPNLHLTQSRLWAEAYLHTKWHLDASSHLSLLPPFLGRGAVSSSSTMWPGPRPTSTPSAILIHPAVWPQYAYGPKIREGGSAPILGRGDGFPSNTKSPGPRPTSVPSDILIHAAVWQQQIWAENCEGCAPLREGVFGPHLTQCGQDVRRPTCMPSFILIRPTVWPQYTNVTDKQDRTDNGVIAWGEPFYERSPQKSHEHSSC